MMENQFVLLPVEAIVFLTSQQHDIPTRKKKGLQKLCIQHLVHVHMTAVTHWIHWFLLLYQEGGLFSF